jgi:hypothetical protein
MRLTTQIVDMYLEKLGTPIYTSSEDTGVLYLAPYPTKTPNTEGSYLDAATLTLLVWKHLHEAPTRREVLDALAVLESLADTKPTPWEDALP